MLVFSESQTAVDVFMDAAQRSRDAFMQRPFRDGLGLYVAPALCGIVKLPHWDKHMLNEDVVSLKNLLNVIRKIWILNNVGTFRVADVMFQAGSSALINVLRQFFRSESCVEPEMGQKLN